MPIHGSLQLQAGYLLICLLAVGLLWLLNYRKVPFGWMHWILGILLWYAMFNSGIHATVAGVVFALMVPIQQLERLELKFHLPVYFIVMPLFALANTAIRLPENSLHTLSGSLSWGIITGLCIGKPLGICAACYLLVRKKWAVLPSSTNWYQLLGGCMLAGIGFTMSIFIATLAFDDNNVQDIAKISVLIASLLAMVAGYVWLFNSPPSPASGKP